MSAEIFIRFVTLIDITCRRFWEHGKYFHSTHVVSSENTCYEPHRVRARYRRHNFAIQTIAVSSEPFIRFGTPSLLLRREYVCLFEKQWAPSYVNRGEYLRTFVCMADACIVMGTKIIVGAVTNSRLGATGIPRD